MSWLIGLIALVGALESARWVNKGRKRKTFLKHEATLAAGYSVTAAAAFFGSGPIAQKIVTTAGLIFLAAVLAVIVPLAKRELS